MYFAVLANAQTQCHGTRHCVVSCVLLIWNCNLFQLNVIYTDIYSDSSWWNSMFWSPCGVFLFFMSCFINCRGFRRRLPYIHIMKTSSNQLILLILLVQKSHVKYHLSGLRFCRYRCWHHQPMSSVVSLTTDFLLSRFRCRLNTTEECMPTALHCLEEMLSSLNVVGFDDDNVIQVWTIFFCVFFLCCSFITLH